MQLRNKIGEIPGLENSFIFFWEKNCKCSSDCHRLRPIKEHHLMSNWIMQFKNLSWLLFRGPNKWKPLGQSTHVHCVRQPNMSHAIKKQYKKNEQNRHFCHNKCSGIFGEEFQGFYDDELMYETELGISTIKSLLNGKVLRPHSCYIRTLHCEIYLWLAESAVFLISTKWTMVNWHVIK